jgi:uncharacterized protein YjdB
MQTNLNSQTDILNPDMLHTSDHDQEGSFFMQSERRYAGYYRFLSILLMLTLVISLLSPAITVSAAATPMFSKTSQSILEGDTYTINIKNKIAGADYTWKSSDKSVAKVSQKGIVTGLNKGTATIRCNVKTKAKSYTLECNVTVRKPAEELLISNKIDYIKIGETYDLNQKLMPTGANEVTNWTSSDPTILSIDKKGIITAKSVGMATITATTSNASDSITVYAVEQEKEEITKKDVVDGKITISDKSYGDLSISSSVGNAKIVMNNVTVGGKLSMESGAAYTVTTNQCTINKVEAVNSLINSFAVGDGEDEGASPSLVAGFGSIIVTIDSECNISVKQSNGAIIQSFSVSTKADGTIQIDLEGFKGDLVIDSQSQSAINISTTACDMTSATVKNATEGQPITLTDTNAGTDQASTIGTVNMSANAALKVDIKSEEVVIAKEVSRGDITISQPVTKLTNDGTQTSMTINSEVRSVTSTGDSSEVSFGDLAKVTNLTVEGAQTNVDLRAGAQVTNVTSTADNTTVNLSEGATIQKISAYGNSTAVEGTGKVNEAVVTGNDTKINTEGTNVQVALGTTNVIVNGIEVKEEEKIAIATPTPTPVPTATPTPKATVTPKVTVTPKPTATPKPTVTPTPKPTVIPVQGPTTPYVPNTPTSAPTPSPSLSPTPMPTKQDKLSTYSNLLGELHTATAKLVTTQNSMNYTAVKNSFTNLMTALITYEELDKTFPQITISDNTSIQLDYADYAEILIASGKEYGLPIRQYYESTTGSQTYEMSLAAANRLIHMVYRINTEGVMFKTDVAAVFTSLTGSASAFRTAMNQLLTDNGDYIPLAENEVAYYQKGMLAFVNEDSIMNAYYKSSSLTFFKAMNCYINLNRYYGELKGSHTKTEQFQILLNNFIDSLPTVTPKYNEGHYAGADYNLTGKKEAVLSAIEAIMNSIDPATVWGDTQVTLTLRGKYEELIIQDIIRKLYTTETYEGGDYEMLNYYRLNRTTLAVNPDDHIIREAIVAVVCCVKDVPEYNEAYLSKYETLTKNIIDAAKVGGTGDADQVYNALVALFDAKLNDPEFADRWKEYTNPVGEDGTANVDKDYYLSFIQSKLQPLADVDENGQKIDSMLYLYDQKGTQATAEDLSQSNYVLKSAVDECLLWIKNNYDTTKMWVYDLMTAIEDNNSTDTYAALSNICDFMQDTYSVKEGKLFTILGPEYAPAYMIVLRDNMLGADSDTDFKRFYNLHSSHDDYNRYIGELENGALWSVSWWLSEEADTAYLEDVLVEYTTWNPIRMDINTAMYDVTASTDAKNEAIMEMINTLSMNDEFMANYFDDIPMLENLSYTQSDLTLYLDAIRCRFNDGTRDENPETSESWYRYPSYEYDQMMQAGEIPNYNLVIGTASDMLRTILLVEQMKRVNYLCSAINQKDPSDTYAALTAIYDHVEELIRTDDNEILPNTYAEAYLQEFQFWIKYDNNLFCDYYNRFINNETLVYTNELEDDITNGFWIAHIFLSPPTCAWMEERFIDAEDCEDELNTLLTTTATGSNEEFGAALEAYYNTADKPIYEVPAEATIQSKYIPKLKNDLLSELNFDGTYENGDISHLHYYSTNLGDFTEGEKLLAIYNTNNWIVNMVYHLQEDSDNYLGRYQLTIDDVIAAAKSDDKEALYAAIVLLFKDKLEESEESANEWHEYIKPYREDETVNIDMDYFLQFIQSKLESGSEQDEEGNPVNSPLYDYDQLGTAVIADDLNAAIYLLKDAVYECELWFKANYEATFTSLQALMKGLEEGNPSTVYAALSDIRDYMSENYQEDHIFTLQSEKYAPIYNKLLRMNMYEWECDFSKFYNLHVSEGDYNRYLSDLENNALWNVVWWMEDYEDPKNWVADECNNYDRWNPVMDQIYTFRYTDNEIANDEERLDALKNIFVLLGTDEEFINSRMAHLPGLENFEPVLEHLWDYWDALSLRIEDETIDMDTVTGDTWYRYALHSYDLAITGNNMPDFGSVEGACIELVDSILRREHIFTLNQLVEAVRAEDASSAYDALAKMNSFFNNVYERSDSMILDAAYAQAYLVDLNNMLKDTSEDSWLYQYSLLNDGNLPEQLSYEIEQLIDNAVYNVQGNLLTADYYNMYLARNTEVINGTANLEAVIAAAYGSSSDFYTVLDKLIKDANLSVYFGEEGATDLVLKSKYASEIQQSMEYNLEHEKFDDDSISWLNYYNNNKDFLGNKLSIVIYECLANIIYTTEDIQRFNETRINTYEPFVMAAITGAEEGDESAVLEALRSIYTAKISENEAGWTDFKQPVDSYGNSLINVSYCIDQIKASLLWAENYLYLYTHNPDPVFQDLQYVIYNLKDMVEESQLSGPAGWIDMINIILYSEDMEEWKVAANNLRNRFFFDPELLQNFNALEQAALVVDESRITAYIDSFARHMADDQLHGEAPNQWFDGIYEYNMRKEEGLLPYEGFLQYVGINMMYILIETNQSLEMFELVNNLYAEVLESDAKGTYSAMASINSFINTTNPGATGTMLGIEYNVAYYNVLKNRIMGTDTSDVYAAYLIEYNLNTEREYSANYNQTLINILYSTQWYTQGHTDANEAITAEYNTYYAWNFIKQSMDDVLLSINEEDLVLLAKLANFTGYAKTEAAMAGFFGEGEIENLEPNASNIGDIRTNIISNLGDTSTSCGQYISCISQGFYPSYDLIRDTCLELSRILINYNVID